VTVEFDLTADVNIALQDAQRKVNEVLNQLPKDAKPPVITKFALDELPVLRMGVTSSMGSRKFYQFVKDRVQPRLSKLSGVGEITLVGGDEREIRVNIDAAKLRSYGLSVLQVAGTIKSANLDFPTGKIKEGDNQYIVRVAGKFTSTDDLRRLVVDGRARGGTSRLPILRRWRTDRRNTALSPGSTAQPRSACSSRNNPTRTPWT
jgi:HAE1 family hydrophobic/amphiphilic exporter-1